MGSHSGRMRSRSSRTDTRNRHSRSRRASLNVRRAGVLLRFVKAAVVVIAIFGGLG
jgi:hypothetical protein